MTLSMVSLTGADDATDPRALATISHRFPFVEWALLYFPEREGTARNPTEAWRNFTLDTVPGNFAAHLCGQQVFREILDPKAALARIDDLKRYDRIQININARHIHFTDDEVLSVYTRLHVAGLHLVLQYHDACKAPIEAFLARLDANGRRRVDLLFDASKGTGLRPDAWPLPHASGVRCGYAGGLGPEVLADEMPRVRAVASASNYYWIDMESGVRTNNQFDLEKVERVLALVAA